MNPPPAKRSGTDHRCVVVGGGMGGLASALALAGQGIAVTLLEAQREVGGKIRGVDVGGEETPHLVDGGPTVFTMKWVFEALFDEAGLTFDDHVDLTKANLLARHAWDKTAWDDAGHLDLFANVNQSADAIGAFCGAKEAQNFRNFVREAAEIYSLLEGPFLRSSKPSMMGMSLGLGFSGFAVRPFSTLWSALKSTFDDPRLIQLFGRYSTYTGASPFLAPATLMLIAHVEMEGVWLVKGGMHALAKAVRKACEAKGVIVRTGAKVDRIDADRRGISAVFLEGGERIEADSIIVNADASALGTGLFGDDVRSAAKSVELSDRSQSAIGWALSAKTSGFPLAHHTVFFGQDYAQEFEAVFKDGRYPADPTVYICAQDRTDDGEMTDGETTRGMNAERMLMVINAPPNGDQWDAAETEMEQCMMRALKRLKACGLTVDTQPVRSQTSVPTGPVGFNRLFPATGGALYGRANHSSFASFQRPENRTKIPGLYLAGGSVHPGPGVPMAALSGRLAAASVLCDLASTKRLHRAVTVGGTSMA